MPDWKNEASRRLERAKFSAAERDDVSRELAGYLEDLCSESRARGTDDSSATVRGKLELNEDPRLGAHLYRARKENNMNDRTKRLWLPGFAVLLASAASLATLQIAGFRPYFPPVFLRGNAWTPNPVYTWVTIYMQWLCVLPFLGAAAAYWSRRAGSNRRLRIAAGLFPVLVFLAVFAIFFPFSFAIDGVPEASALIPELLGAILSWVVIPGVALLVGVLPFLLNPPNRSQRMDSAISA